MQKTVIIKPVTELFFSSLLTSQIRIRVGEYDFSSVQEELPYVERAVARKVVHPKYNFFTYEYDLALVQLDKSLEFAPHISPICLPASDDLLIGENATVTGWGRLSEGGTLPSVLQEVSHKFLSRDYWNNFCNFSQFEEKSFWVISVVVLIKALGVCEWGFDNAMKRVLGGENKSAFEPRLTHYRIPLLEINVI